MSEVPFQNPSPNHPTFQKSCSWSSPSLLKVESDEFLEDFANDFIGTPCDISISSKDAKDHLLNLHAQLQERVNTNYATMNGTAGKEKDQLRCKESILLLKALFARLQLGIYDSHMVLELASYLSDYERSLQKNRELIQQLHAENSLSKQKIQTLKEQISVKEAQVANAREMIGHWGFLRETMGLDAQLAGTKLTQHELWRGIFHSAIYNIQDNLLDIAEPEKRLYYEVRRLISNNDVSSAIREMKYFVRSTKLGNSNHLAYILLMLAHYCEEDGRYKEAVEVLTSARQIFTSIHGISCKQAAVVSCRIAYCHVNEEAWDKALDALSQAVTDLCTDSDYENSILLSKILFNMGYFCYMMDQTQTGFRAMELVVMALERLLPGSEEDWSWCSLMLAKLLNQHKYYAAALFLACDTFQYYMDNREDLKDKVPIYEIAAAQSESHVFCRLEDLPSGCYITSTFQQILGEMKMAFTGMGRIAAADLLEHFMNTVVHFEDSISMVEGKVRQELTRFIDRIEQQRRFSQCDVEVSKLPKKESKISPILIHLLQQNRDSQCPLEYKTVENRLKTNKSPIRSVLNLFKKKSRAETLTKTPSMTEKKESSKKQK